MYQKNASISKKNKKIKLLKVSTNCQKCPKKRKIAKKTHIILPKQCKIWLAFYPSITKIYTTVARTDVPYSRCGQYLLL